MISKETHIAVVADNQDPEKRGRIKVRCLGLLGDDETVIDWWIDPCFDWGWFYVPDLNEQVEIEVTNKSDTDEYNGQAFIDEPDMRWRGKRFYDQENTAVNDVFKENYGKQRGFSTPSGHVVMFDDTEGSEKISISFKGGNIKIDINEDTISIQNENTQIDVSSDKIQLGEGTTEPMVLGNKFKTIYDAHTHSTAMGPSGPPVVPLPSDNLSAKVFGG